MDIWTTSQGSMETRDGFLFLKYLLEYVSTGFIHGASIFLSVKPQKGDADEKNATRASNDKVVSNKWVKYCVCPFNTLTFVKRK